MPHDETCDLNEHDAHVEQDEGHASDAHDDQRTSDTQHTHDAQNIQGDQHVHDAHHAHDYHDHAHDYHDHAHDYHDHAHDAHHHHHEHHEHHAHHHHGHHHEAAPASDHDRSVALLQYMVDHNRSHAEELEQLADGLSANVAAIVREAVGDFNQANDKLASALAVLKEE